MLGVMRCGLGRHVRPLSTLPPARFDLLREVYRRFSDMDKKSPQFIELATTGKAWEDYFQPGNSERYGYVKLQEKHAHVLAEIDEYKELMKPQIPELAKLLVAEYAHQSVQIENNPLMFGAAGPITECVEATLFRNSALTGMALEELVAVGLPGVPEKYASSAGIELRNHIIASQWVAENAPKLLGTSGLTEVETRHLSALTIAGTDSEDVYKSGWGARVEPGDYRQTPIGVKSNPLRIFPCHVEVPALVKRFFEWRDRAHHEQNLHPIILACQMFVYFAHIHPFPDGNGRVSRMLMHDYMVRQSYLPIVFQDIDRLEYIKMISDAQDGNPEAFVISVLETQLDELHTFYTRAKLD